MSLREACLIVVVALASAGGPVEDTNNAITFVASYRENGPLTFKCKFDVSKSAADSLTKLKLFTSLDGSVYEPVGSITAEKLTYGLKRKVITLSGVYGQKSNLVVTWVSPDDGFCRYYRCNAKGREPNQGKLVEVFQTVQILSRDGSGCN
ncbi:hypothetical protein PoB_002031200 [Plakobranchus ocellatus]|uniref:Reelin domain-containing protein n=1 Tax=Plakobranchus ocellatus TaxID=259542 RepID=A0AAV3ZH35_9GAST|nr:hypothetical protein PoB_002031200 [Plakobranchus ocellatus]